MGLLDKAKSLVPYVEIVLILVFLDSGSSGRSVRYTGRGETLVLILVFLDSGSSGSGIKQVLGWIKLS